MTGIDILLIVIGAVLVIVSFIITEKVSGHENETADGRELWSERDEAAIKDRINILLSDKSEQIVNDTDDRLCHLSNEKIMEFQEYSEQINEKLNENHNQSVFLYKMLTDKQSEMKEWISELDSKYAGIKDEFYLVEELIKKIKRSAKKAAVKENKAADVKETKADSDVNTVKEEIPADSNTDIPPVTEEVPKVEEKPAEMEEQPSEDENIMDNPKASSMSNKNERILELFDSGKSMIEVSKQLGIGQGEVKLVLDLYRGNKK